MLPLCLPVRVAAGTAEDSPLSPCLAGAEPSAELPGLRGAAVTEARSARLSRRFSRAHLVIRVRGADAVHLPQVREPGRREGRSLVSGCPAEGGSAGAWTQFGWSPRSEHLPGQPLWDGDRRPPRGAGRAHGPSPARQGPPRHRPGTGVTPSLQGQARSQDTASWAAAWGRRRSLGTGGSPRARGADPGPPSTARPRLPAPRGISSLER